MMMKAVVARPLRKTLRLRAIALSCFLCLPAGFAVASDEGGTPFESFQIIIDRNIFSPRRQQVRFEDNSLPEVHFSESEASERIYLTGALIYGATAVAFFEGARSEDEAVISRGGAIKGYQVVDINTDGIKLKKDEERIELPVGSGLSRQGDGRWIVLTGSFDPSSRFEPGQRTSFRSGSESEAAQRPATGEASEPSHSAMLRALMERRRREIEQ